MSGELKNLFQSIDSPYIVKIFDVIVEDDQVLFIYEDCDQMESLYTLS